MNKLLKLSSGILLALMLFAYGCEIKSDLTPPTLPNTGNADFTRFVTIGNSLTMGEQSSSVFESGQMYSFGNQIADLVGASFAQAIFSDPGTGGRIEVASVSPFKTTINTGKGQPTNLTYPAPYNNLGIKGAFLYDMMNTTDSTNSFTAQFGRFNPLFNAVLRGIGTIFQQAKALHPTFMTCWIGNNDILGYATSGGTLPNTPTATFQFLYSQLMDSLASLNTKVIVGNIPLVTSIPFFTTVPPALPDGQGGIITLYGQTAGGVRALVPGQDLLLLTASSVLLDANGNPTGVGISPANPLPTQVVLDKDEIANVISVTSAYNTAIKTLAEAKGFKIFDANAIMNGLATQGYEANGIMFTSEYVAGNFFSLDGVHPTSQGYAIIANEFIKIINHNYAAKIPYINVATVPASFVLAKKVQLGKYGIPIVELGTFDNLLF